MDELKREGERMIGEEIVEEGLKSFQEVNFAERRLHAHLFAAE
jgi:hypothetical protein